MSTDLEWERWGAIDPYFGVLTDPRFRAEALTPQARDEFFSSGVAHVGHVLSLCRRHFEPDFQPASVLDFGCGVGRLVVPFAQHAAQVVGLDISPSMLAEARRNCEERGAPNVVLQPSDDELSNAPGPFDLVHSCIVLQHIPIERGRRLFEKLVQRVRPGGFGALHVTYAWTKYASTYGQAPPPPPPPPWTVAFRIAVRSLLRQLLAPLRPKPSPALQPVSNDPEMQMNFYNLSELMFVLQGAGASRLCTELTDHGGALGAFIVFQRGG